MIIRSAGVNDAEELLALLKWLDTESQFMLFEPDERQTTVTQQRERIAHFSDSPFKNMLVAVNSESNEIMGFTLGIGNDLARTKHTILCVIGVLEKFSGNGVGKALLQRLEHWAGEKKVHRLELTVMEHNVRAIGLYKALGFEVEGVKRDSIKLNGKYINEHYMAKLIYAE